MSRPKYVYLNDRVVPWDEGNVHIASVGFRFGTNVFEGLRGYWNDRHEQMYVLQLSEHMQRLEYSQKFMRFDTILPGQSVADAVLELLRANEFRENVHIMASVFVDGVGAPHTTGPVGLAISAAPRRDIPWTQSGCAAHISSWQRVPDTAMPMRVKCGANYQNGRLATLQAHADGYDTAILLNSRGKVAEGPGMCLFMIRDGKVVTPPVTSDILESITRRTVMTLCDDYLGMKVLERDIDRSEFAAAQEAFFCGTAWEVTPLISVDRLPVGAGEVGPAVRRLQEVFFGIAAGDLDDHPEWRTPLYG